MEITKRYPASTQWKRTAAALALLALIVTAAITYAQVGGGYDLSWSSVDGGGGTASTGGVYSLGGTIGQPDAGAMSGGIYGLTGGFWSVASSVLVGHVSWQGRTAGTTAYQVPLTLTLKAGTAETGYLGLTTDANGYFTVSVGSLPAGTYNWRVKGPDATPNTNTSPGFLANAGSVTLTTAAVTNAEMGLMRAGDANNDNVVGATDFTILKSTFGKAGCPTPDPGYDNRADFTGDCVVSSQDFSLFKANFGTAGAPPVSP